MKLIEYSTAFATGAVAYTFIEILWRGYTHPSMTVAGGLCLALMYMWNGLLESRPLPLRWLVGALTITAVEFVFGCVVNLWLKQNVWDYSSLRFNLMGQVSLAFFFAWYGLSIPGFGVCGVIKKMALSFER